MLNSVQNIESIKKIALALGALNERVVFVGGAVVALYADDPAAEDVRPTKDVDITFEIVSFAELTRLQEELTSKGFYPAPEQNIICRFRYQNILVDVMSTRPVGWGPTNPWFAPGFKHIVCRFLDNVKIRMLSFPYFLATKFSPTMVGATIPV
ncbi:MAG: hypothetical protein GXO77_00395 [Calditrichaeota bacterium]|nr:hypothetical protein [Calditrichota bacterium]